MNRWGELLAHPAWRALDQKMAGRRVLLEERLLELARSSSDPAVRATAYQIYAIDEWRNTPVEEAAEAE